MCRRDGSLKDVWQVQQAKDGMATYILGLPEDPRLEMAARLDAVRRIRHNLGYAVGDDMDDLFAGNGLGTGPE